MDNRTGSVYFNKEQIDYLMFKTGSSDAREAVEIFAILIKEENVDPMQMPLYVDKMMEKDGLK